MDFPWIPLLFNLALLGVMLFICRTINASQGKLIWNGAMLFFVLCSLAMVLDYTLTMVFASASFHDHTQYESMSSRTAWAGRILSYVIPCVLSLLLALRFRKRQRFAAKRAGTTASTSIDEDGPVVIRTSPYTESELPL
ncbi:hypothetical protein [Caballeronia sp. BR00000012568055]|uniref:hypothetical protein n=1 Tax=Caballeronia sp. BR00000012568055 TaxID=2918761 RepID=UPI0023F8AC2E|nr:hypothetical protein [Caballeronia sp. BR00000012568055]